jgi:hypothetical protein
MLPPLECRAKSICQEETIRSLRSQRRTLAEKYLTELGAGNIALLGVQEALKKNGVGVLTITSP